MKTRLVLTLVAAATYASATNISANLTVDNGFDYYLSTSDSVLGNLIGSGNNWQVTSQFTSALTAGVKNYIHVVATNAGGPAGFIGDFTLDDTSFQFANGTQHLLKNPVDWAFNTTGFGNPYGTPTSEGTNGVGPWGTVSNVSGAAAWLWDGSDLQSAGPLFFTSAITSLSSSATPEPGMFAPLAFAVAFLARRRSKRA
jgi:hypothetical protein